jgi:hypothetical protein
MAAIGEALMDRVKLAGSVLATISGFAYACGYLVSRSRARALGIDFGFALVNEVYVFRGFRFLLLLLLTTLMVSPVILIAHGVALYATKGRRPSLLMSFEIFGIVYLAFVVIGLFVVTLLVSDALLRRPAGWFHDALWGAILGRNPVGLAVTFATVAVTACATYWLIRRSVARRLVDGLTWSLVLEVTLLVLLLPIQNGAFWADHVVQTFEHPPAELGPAGSSFWVIDRNADRVVLLLSNAAGTPKLVTYPADKLDGITMTGSVPLEQLPFFHQEP